MDIGEELNTFDLGEGIFEILITDHLAGRLQALSGYKRTVEPIVPENAPGELARFLGRAIEKRLGALTPDQMIDLSNQILDMVGHSQDVLPGPKKLLELQRDDAIRMRSFKRPQTSLSSAALLTN
ncbi:hypothetical protein BZG21_44135, partial [Escherichia coli]|nr:hypothetical protein [Escherichia coli]